MDIFYGYKNTLDLENIIYSRFEDIYKHIIIKVDFNWVDELHIQEKNNITQVGWMIDKLVCVQNDHIIVYWKQKDLTRSNWNAKGVFWVFEAIEYMH